MMARIGSARDAGTGEWRGRLDSAREFHRSAGQLLAGHAQEGTGNSILLLIVHAAIAYGDALTSKNGGKVNQKNHAQLPKLLAAALGARSNPEQVKRLDRLLSEKDAAAYGARVARPEHIAKLFEQLERFARWAEDLLAEP